MPSNAQVTTLVQTSIGAVALMSKVIAEETDGDEAILAAACDILRLPFPSQCDATRQGDDAYCKAHECMRLNLVRCAEMHCLRYGRAGDVDS